MGKTLLKLQCKRRRRYNKIIIKKFENVAIGSIPIMVHSDICILHGQGSDVLRELGECVYDTGGYFIIKFFK